MRLIAEEHVERSGRGEVGEDARGAARGERFGGAEAGGDGDGFCPDGLCGGDIFGRVADHDNAALGGGEPELQSPARCADPEQLRAVFVIAAEAAEREAIEEPDAPEL